jgi:hypothetical protein
MSHGFIIFRCPATGMDVQTSLNKQQEGDGARNLEAVTCAACTRIHFINMTTGKVAGPSR